jgi:voltage-gated potassium channel
LRYTALLAFLTALAGAAAFRQAEQGESFWDGLYWAITTMTTVGYGDLAPVNTVGKIIAVIVMHVGLSPSSRYSPARSPRRSFGQGRQGR